MRKIATRAFVLSCTLLIHALSCLGQTDVEFWFVAPEISIGHGIFPGGEPVYFRVSALDLDATVRIYQPANNMGMDTTFTVPASSTVSIDASPWIDFLENRPGGTVLDKGVHIVSSNLITVYYDEDEYYNEDIFALKGRNALGLEFYTPFNNVWRNSSAYTPLPYSAVDIVATEDNTVITITPTANLVGGQLAGIPFVIVLDEGETYSCLATTQLAAGHLGGTHITSSKPIAVTIKDDSTEGNICHDLIGDQTVPIVNVDGSRIVGYEYIVMRGKINLIDPLAIPPDPDGVATGERIFIMATEPNTTVSIDGAVFTTINNPGEQAVYEIRNNSTHVEGDKPIMVLHASGFGCELGGAVLPTVDGCTGSVEVSFTRSTDRDFYLNIMTFDAAKHDFTMHYEDGSTFAIPVTWFEPVGTTDFVCLKKGNKFFANNRGGGVPQGEVVKITNGTSVFHLGLIEGGRTSGCKYGYFSDYSEARGGVLIVETGSKSIFRCFGDTVQLRANGGISYTWSPSDYLNDAFIATPIATPPPGVYNYDVTITRGCFPDTTVTVIVGIAEEVEAFFEMDEWYICAPETVTIENLSTGADFSDISNVQWDFDFEDPGNPYVYDTTRVFEYVFNNTTDTVQRRTLQLVVWNNQSCASEFRRDIIIRPEINASFTNIPSEGCHPLTVDFDNTSTGNTGRYKWNLGDGNSANTEDVIHTYLNHGMADSIYHVEMVAISPFYCSDTAETDITVYPYLEADFATDTFQGCSPLLIYIDNNSAGYIEEYEWTFGDGDSSSTSASYFTHTYTNTTTSPIQCNLQLVVKNNTRGCYDTIVRVISVFPEVTSGFTPDNASVCHGSDVSFTNLSSPTAAMFEWDFGDGGSSSSIDPVHNYENTSPANVDYTVRLISTTIYLCSDTSYGTVRTHPYIEAEYSVNEFQGCSPFQIDLENASEGAITGYTWDWGDGSPPSTSGGASLTHVYVNSGPATVTYDLSLVVRNADNCTDSMTRQITVFPEVTSQFTQDTTEGCNELPVAFTNQSSPSATSFLWEFGDGGSSDQRDPDHLFQNFGTTDTTYTTRLIAYTNENCTDTSNVDITVYSYVKADFTFGQATICSPYDLTFNNSSVGGVSFHWDFGDGSDTTVTNTNPVTHRYANPSPTDPVTHQVRLTVTNARGCPSVDVKEVTVLPHVHAEFTADETEGCHPLTVQFSNASSGADIYLWDFGNGQSSDQENPSMTFENYGLNDTVFNVRLITSNEVTCADSFLVSVLVHPYVEAEFTIEYLDQCSPAKIAFHNSSVNGQQYAWDFNGEPLVTTSMATINRQFINPNPADSVIYPVELEVTSPQGCISRDSGQVTIFPYIEAGISGVTEGCHPLQVDFTNVTEGGYTYWWDFDDGASSDEDEPSHLFTNYTDEPVTRTVYLAATSQFYCTHDTTVEITIYPKPVARFETPSVIDCAPFEITFTNTSLRADEYVWELGSDTTITTASSGPVTHTFDNLTADIVTNEIVLVASTGYGCLDTAQQNIYVYPRTIADFSVNDGDCSPFYAHFVNESVRGEKYLWEFGDGTYASTTDPSNLYFNLSGNDTTYVVTLTSTSQHGCVDTHSDTIDVYAQPFVEFIASPTIQMYPSTTVDLTNMSNQGYWNYRWDMGDGTTSTLEDPGSHTYDTWGEFTISLAAETPHCYDSISHSITILPAAPVAAFDSITGDCAPYTVQFVNTSLYGETYLWDFDDGNTSSEFAPVHTYEDHGFYNVRLTVTGQGGRDYAYRQVEVFRLPEADFRVAPSLVMLPEGQIYIFNLSKYATTYQWDFGDGTTSTEEKPKHQYTETGVYDISLETWTDEGCYDSIVRPAAVTVEAAGLIKFPNAFKPYMHGGNGGYYSQENDEQNLIFHPYWEGVDHYHLEIYNRWGERLFTSEDVNIGWDGYRDEELCDQGVYFFKCTGTFINGVPFRVVGDVTLIHHDKGVEYPPR